MKDEYQQDEDLVRYKLQVNTEDLALISRQKERLHRQEELLLNNLHCLTEQLRTIINNRNFELN